MIISKSTYYEFFELVNTNSFSFSSMKYCKISVISWNRKFTNRLKRCRNIKLCWLMNEIRLTRTVRRLSIVRITKRLVLKLVSSRLSLEKEENLILKCGVWRQHIINSCSLTWPTHLYDQSQLCCKFVPLNNMTTAVFSGPSIKLEVFKFIKIVVTILK